ncbi:hypothetical protein HJC23_008013 [Cyclotella cryptica]|uniref:Eukaryotic translation initiation factor 4C n=1 Tax=Cyclotella cryptica TaxID=29204 RepID=A0ABD3Q3I7_9STRA
MKPFLTFSPSYVARFREPQHYDDLLPVNKASTEFEEFGQSTKTRLTPIDILSISSTMPKPKGKGGKNRRRGKGDGEEAKRELEFKEEGQEYAQVVRMLGNGRCECFCYDGVTRLGHIRGKMRKKVWVTAGDIVLVGKRDFQDEKVDILHKYSADEARNLKQYGELPETARINETAVDQAMAGEGDDDDIGIDFDDI